MVRNEGSVRPVAENKLTTKDERQILALKGRYRLLAMVENPDQSIGSAAQTSCLSEPIAHRNILSFLMEGQPIK
jgi:hypothetical protein